MQFRRWLVENEIHIPDSIRNLLEEYATNYWQLNKEAIGPFSDALEELGGDQLMPLANALRNNDRETVEKMHFGPFSPANVIGTSLLVRDDLSIKQLAQLPPPTASDYAKAGGHTPVTMIYPTSGYNAYAFYKNKWFWSMEHWGKAKPQTKSQGMYGHANLDYDHWRDLEQRSLSYLQPSDSPSTPWRQFVIGVPLSSIKKVPSEVLLAAICNKVIR